MEGPMMEARALTPLISCSFLHSFPAFFSHHHHHPCLATSSISFLGGIGIALPSHLVLHNVLGLHFQFRLYHAGYFLVAVDRPIMILHPATSRGYIAYFPSLFPFFFQRVHFLYL